MPTWRRRDLERRHSERRGRVTRLLRGELLLAVAALVVAGVALWQALAAQSRADLLGHDLAAANAHQRGEGLPDVSTAPGAASAQLQSPPALPPLPASSSGGY